MAKKLRTLIQQRKRGLILVFLACMLIIWLYWGNVSILVSHYEVQSSRIPDAFSGYTIVQVSDLYNAEFGQKESRLLKKIRKENPDIIAVTGDLIDSSHTSVETAMEFITGAMQIAPVYYVTGNHEAWSSSYADLRIQLEAAGVTILDGKTVLLTVDGQTIELMGIDDPDFNANVEAVQLVSNELEQMTDESNRDSYSILLAHRPELYEVYVESEIDLVLSGHAHGGQFVIPFLGGVVAPDQGFFPEYTSGMFKDSQTTMIVSRGLGNSIIPIRINNNPELVVITLAT